MSLLSILATVTGITSSVAMLPQAYKINKRKSAKDISPITYLYLVMASLIWVLYGLEIENLPLVISNGLGVFILSIILVEWHIYGR
jgi:MtN3 and saliva related transmembrane protein